MTYEFRDEDANVIENVGNKAFFLALFFAFGGLILIIIAGINEDNYSNGIVFWLVLRSPSGYYFFDLRIISPMWQPPRGEILKN
jgi:hypothetical protein